jgi:excisionase family DNA binding protein
MNQDRFLKLKEVQEMIGVSRSTVWRWHAERGLRVVTIGGVTRIRESDLQAFLSRHESKPQPDAGAHRAECEAFTSAR